MLITNRDFVFKHIAEEIFMYQNNFTKLISRQNNE